jgi:hypothetical protein
VAGGVITVVAPVAVAGGITTVPVPVRPATPALGVAVLVVVPVVADVPVVDVDEEAPPLTTRGAAPPSGRTHTTSRFEQ